MSTAETLVGGMGVVFSGVLAVLLLLWFFLPFAVFGIKDKLDDIIKLLVRIDKNLSPEKSEYIKELRPDAPKRSPRDYWVWALIILIPAALLFLTLYEKF